jgi:F-type H+-transporting ATPase subunit epsilon
VIEVVSEKGAPTQKIFISGGFADVTASNCTVLAEEAIKVMDIDVPAIEAEIKSLSEDMTSGRDPMETARIQRRLGLAKAKLAAATDKRAA